MKTRIRKGDLVVAVAGRERFAGKTGRVLRVFPGTQRAIVEGFNLSKRHMRPTQKNPKGGIVQKERSIHISNLMPYCAKCRRGVRTGSKQLADGSAVRCCRVCGEPVGKA